MKLIPVKLSLSLIGYRSIRIRRVVIPRSGAVYDGRERSDLYQSRKFGRTHVTNFVIIAKELPL